MISKVRIARYINARWLQDVYITTDVRYIIEVDLFLFGTYFNNAKQIPKQYTKVKVDVKRERQ